MCYVCVFHSIMYVLFITFKLDMRVECVVLWMYVGGSFNSGFIGDCDSHMCGSGSGAG